MPLCARCRARRRPVVGVRRAQPRQAGAPRAPRGVFAPRAGRGDVIAWLWVVRCRAPRAAAKTKELMPPPGPHSAPTSFIPQHAHTMTSKGLHARRSTMPRTQAPGQAHSLLLSGGDFCARSVRGRPCRGRALHTELPCWRPRFRARAAYTPRGCDSHQAPAILRGPGCSVLSSLTVVAVGYVSRGAPSHEAMAGKGSQARGFACNAD